MNALALPPRLLTKSQLATALGMCPRKVQQMARSGEIPAIQISRRLVRFDLEEVVTVLNHKFGGRA